MSNSKLTGIVGNTPNPAKINSFSFSCVAISVYVPSSELWSVRNSNSTKPASSVLIISVWISFPKGSSNTT